MSTLQAQLAALSSNSTTNPTPTSGFTTTTAAPSHSDRTGRGIHHSVQPGGSTSRTRGGSTKYQPTLLYDTTRVAADVPLSTLHQQFDQAVQQLVSSSTNANGNATYSDTLAHVSSVLSSSSSSTPNETPTVKTVLPQLFLIVSSLLSECGGGGGGNASISLSSSQPTPPTQHEYYLPSLYILEYLLRQYQIHCQFSQE